MCVLGVLVVTREDVSLRHIQVLNSHVEVELLGVSWIRPSRRPIVFHPLEEEHEPAVGM
jgi:hypothetical protein